MRGINRFRRKLTAPSRQDLENKYERRSPHGQNAVDLVPGWNTALPEAHGITAGTMPLYTDLRITWALEQHGPLDGARVLELGPLEASHSYMLEQAGAGEVLAIEANKQAYIKCLIAKEILGLRRCRFLLGDFEKYLIETDETFDVILASGVLYHMNHPVEVLDLMARKCRTLILWTHYFDAEVLHAQDPRLTVFEKTATRHDYGGRSYTLHGRSYHGAWHADQYCGGPDDTHYWMERADILSICEANGFDDIRVAFEDHDGANGPSCMFYMTKTPAPEAEPAPAPEPGTVQDP